MTADQQRIVTLCRKKTQLIWYYGLASLLCLALATAEAYSPAQAPAATPLDEPLRLIYDAQNAYRGIRDYTCLLVKREQIKGRLQPDNIIILKVRTNAFSVYMKWQAPKEILGQQVCYVAGRYNGNMRAESKGILGVFGFQTIAVDDPRVLECSRHTVKEAGIGNLIDHMARAWEKERQLNLTQVGPIGEYEYNRRHCIRVETFHPVRGPQVDSYRTVLYFDKENHLPIRVEVYDWPRQGGSPTGDLIETYSYANLKLNVGLRDDAFDY